MPLRFPRISVSSQMLRRGLAWSVCLPHVIPVFHPFSIHPQAWTGPGARLGAAQADGTTGPTKTGPIVWTVPAPRPLPRITTTGPT